MAYNKKGYYIRAKLIQEITSHYYEPENQSKSHKMVWKTQIHPRFGIGYRAYLNYCKVSLPEDTEEEEMKKVD